MEPSSWFCPYTKTSFGAVLPFLTSKVLDPNPCKRTQGKVPYIIVNLNIISHIIISLCIIIYHYIMYTYIIIHYYISLYPRPNNISIPACFSFLQEKKTGTSGISSSFSHCYLAQPLFVVCFETGKDWAWIFWAWDVFGF